MNQPAEQPTLVVKIGSAVLMKDGVRPDRVLLMPQGMTSEELQEKSGWVAGLCKSYGFRFCPRIHIDLYGHTRGT